jgi:5-methylthioribose kinase
MSSADGADPGQAMQLAGAERDDLTAYLHARGWLDESDRVRSVEPAGDGNMNCTRRVVTAARRLVLKQGRPWVEKYPDIPAPPDRTLVEAAFYARVAVHPDLRAHLPTLVGVDAGARLLALEECVGFSDLVGVYEGDRLAPATVDTLLRFLRALHALPVTDPTARPWANQDMRELNHAYIFALPLRHDETTDRRLEQLTIGLGAAASALRADRAYGERVARLGAIYRQGPPRALIHGDYYPGSWLGRGRDVVVIDPEFCFAGAPEFDYGVMAAHLILGGQDDALVGRVGRAAAAAGSDPALVAGFAGVEVMRRLIGVAQLPRLTPSLAAKQAWLARSRRLVLDGSFAV